MQYLTQAALTQYPKRYRAKLINSLSGFKSANLIGTSNGEGTNNLAIFSSVIHLGASPALVGFVIRPDSVARHTLNNIIKTKHYTINQVTSDFYQKAHQTSARYQEHQDEFKQVGLTPLFTVDCTAPFVKESQIKYSVKLKEILPIALNNTSFVIGEIDEIFYPDEAIQPDGHIDIEAQSTVCISGLDSYHQTSQINRLSYALPDEKLSILKVI